MALKVLIPVDHAVGISGPHRNVVGTLNALTARDDTSVVLVTGKIDEHEPYAQSSRIDIRLGYQPQEPSRLLANARLLHAAAKGCDLIYVPTNLRSLLYAQFVRLRRPIVAGPNVSHLPLPWRHDSPGKIELRLLSDAWFENSRLRQAHVQEQAGVTEVGCIHHAIDLQRFSPAARRTSIWDQFGIGSDQLKVLFVGRDSEARKGVPQLFDAIECIGQTGRADIHFVLVGSFGEGTSLRAASLPNTTILGFRQGEELATLCASADIGVVPSSWESFGFVLLEAMATGLPVVCTDIAAFREIKGPDQAVAMVACVCNDGRFDPDAGRILADAIISLADNAGARSLLGERARRRAEEHFSEERLGKELVDLFARFSPLRTRTE